MENRIDLRFKELKGKNKKALIAFVTSVYPDKDTSKEIVKVLAKQAVDIVELGIPYSDPIADGAVIQAASSKVLENGVRIKDIMNMVSEIRKEVQIPLVYMVYFGCVFKYGIEKFMKDSKAAGIDGVIIPDLPLEERASIVELADKAGVYIIPLVAPTSENRIKAIVEGAKGFVYCVSSNGVTGVRSKLETDIKEYTELVSKFTEVPKCIGFGISGADMAEKIKAYCDGVIIGSAIMKIIEGEKDKSKMLKSLEEFTADVSKVL